MVHSRETPAELVETHPHLKDLFHFFENLKEESERGQVMICTSMLDDMLLATIKGFLIEGDSALKLLKGFNAPLGTLSARIEAAHALGLINDEEHQDATSIRKIRNKFAHSLSSSFSDDDIRDLCSGLNFKTEDFGREVRSPHDQFGSAAMVLILQLAVRPNRAAERRLSLQELGMRRGRKE